MTTSRNTNLLVALHHWASRQDENFITDAFAHLLRHLIARDKIVGMELLSYLTNERLSVTFDDTPIEIRTQVTVLQGRPDIEIRSLHHLIYVEAKVESGLGDNQLERYVDELNRKASTSSTLVVLSRYPVEIPSTISNRVVARRWYQIAYWLHDKLEQGALNDVVNQFLVKQLIDFFEGRNILMEKVGPELVTGIRAFRSLIAMVSEAIAAHQLTMNRSVARDYTGYYFDQEKQDFFLGLYYERPEFLVFETYNFAVVPDAAEKLGFGKRRGKNGWECSLPLHLEERCFFSFDRKQQMEYIAKFVGDSINAVNKVRQI